MKPPANDSIPTIVGPEAESIRALGEDLRNQAEYTARHNPQALAALFRKLRQASDANPKFKPWSLWIEGGTQHLRGHTAEASSMLKSAACLFRRSGDHHTAARVDLAGMDILACMGRHRAARRVGQRALQTFEQTRDIPRTVSALLNLGGLEEAQDQLHKALKFWRRAPTTRLQ